MRIHLLLVLLVTGATMPIQAEPPKKVELKLSEMEQAVVDLTNLERKNGRLPPLEPNPLLFAAARKYAAKMAKAEKLESEFDGITLADRVQSEKYHYSLVVENIAAGQKTGKSVVAGWMKSESHREKILMLSVSEIGVGVEKSANGQFYWTQIFGSPRK